MPGLHFEITGDNSNFLHKLEESRNGVRSTSKQIEESGMRIEQMFGRMTKAAAAFGAGFSAQQFASQVMKVRGEFQQLEVAFNTMLGSKEKADTLMSQLVRTAAITPFDLQGVANGAKQLLAYGTAAEDVNSTLVRLGDIAAGLSIPLGDLVYLYGTTMTQGRLFTQDLRQFQGRGIPLADELAKQFGVAKDKVGELVTAGKVGFPEVQKAIEAMTNDGGKFGGLMESQSKTITGQISNIEDAISTMYNNIGKQSEGFINDALSGVFYLVENYETIGKTILELAAVYGTYKAVLMSVAAYQSFATGVTYSAEIAELSKLIPLKKQSANEDVIAAVASGKLTQSKAEQIIALRAEIAAKIQSLQATEAQTKAEYASAMAIYKSATQRMLVAKQNMDIAQSQMSIAIKSGTVDEIAAAKKNAQTASLELNNAAIAKNTARKSLNIASTNKKTATDALSTMQTGVNTAVQNANTTSTNILTVAKTRLASASRALGLSMLANPYVLVAAAVAGLGYGIYKLITYQTDAEKAQLKLNESIKEYHKKSLSEQRELAKLKGELSALAKGTDEYNTVKDKIVKNFGKYYSGLDAEIEKVGLTETAYNKLTEAINKSFGARQYEKFITERQKELSSTMAENLGKIQDKLYEKLGDEQGAKIYAKIRNGIIQGAISIGENGFYDIKGIDSETKNALDKAAGKDGGLFDVTNRAIEGYIRNIITANKMTDELDKKAKERFGVDSSSISSSSDIEVDVTPKGNKTLELLISDIEAAKEKLKTLQAQANKGLISPDDIKEQSDALSKLKAEYELRTGKDYDKLDSELKKTVDERLKAEQQLNKELLNLQFQNRQHEIDQMKEGAEKKLAQIELDYDKEISLIMEKENEWKKAQGGKLTKEQTVEIRTAYVNGWMKKESGTHTVIKEQLEAEQQALNDYLKTYGTFQQQKLAIAQEYEEKIKKAQEESSVNSPQVKLLIKERDVAIQNKETEAIKANIDWATVFGEFGGMFNDMVKPVLEEAKKYVQTDKFKNSDQASQKALIDAINQMEKSLGGAGGLNFKKLGQEVQIYQSSLRELNDAKNEEAEAINKLKKAQEDYEKALKNGTEEEKQVTKDALDAAQQNADVASANVQVQTNIANESQQNLTETATMLRLNMDNVVEGLSKLASGGINSAYQGLLQAGSTMKGAIGEIAKNLKDVPIIGWIVAIIDVFKDGLSNVVGGLLDAIFNAVSGILSDVLSGDLFVTIGKSLRDGIGNILNSISFGGWNSLMDKISGSNAKEVQEAIDRLTDRNEILGNSIDKLTDVMEKESGSKSISAYKQASEYQKEQNANTLQIAREQARYHGSHRSWQYYMGWTNEQIQWARKNVDKKFSGTDSLWELTPEQMKMLLSNADIYKQISDAGKGGYGNRIMEKLEAYADNAGKLEELTDKINESLMQVSFDGLRDSFLDSLMDMDKDAKSFSEDFSEYMQRALLNFSIGEVIDEDLKKWYNDLAELMKAQNGKLTEKQLEDARIAYDEMVQKAMDLRDELAAATGYDKVSQESTSQSATSKSFSSMSQDTGNELNGRFTAFQISNEEIKSAMMSMLVYVDIISVSIDSNSRTLIEIRNLMITSNGYLENIADYTKKILDRFGANLNSINKNIEKAL